MNVICARALSLLFVAALASPTGAHAALNAYLPPNYTFPDQISGFHLNTRGGDLNPGVLLGFNPLTETSHTPDPLLDLSNPFDPKAIQLGDGSVFKFELALTGLGHDGGLLLPAVQKPDLAGLTRVEFTADGSVFVLTLGFSGPGGVSSWVSFNPQPDPPGDFMAYEVGFGGDATVGLQLTENGSKLSFASAPEPSTWALMGIGFAALGVLGYRRTARSPALAFRA
jgi:hypothetical protein